MELGAGHFDKEEGALSHRYAEFQGDPCIALFPTMVCEVYDGGTGGIVCPLSPGLPVGVS